MSTLFTVNVALNAAYSDANERAALAAPFFHTLAIFSVVVFAAFALHLRILWHLMQLIVVLTLLIAATYLRRDVPVRRYYSRKALSTYERTHLSSLEVRWHLTLIAYALWIVYGAALHDGRHATADMSLLDSYLPESSMTIMISSVIRFIVLMAISTISASPSSMLFILDVKYIKSTRLRVTCALAVYALLLALPSEDGVPQALSVGSAVMRYAAFALLFVANEQWRIAVEHHLFIVRLCSDTLCADELKALRSGATEERSKHTIHVNNTSSPLTADCNAHLPRDVEAFDLLPISLSTLSVVRAAWVLTAPSNIAAFTATLISITFMIIHTTSWTLWSRKRAIHRIESQASVHKATDGDPELLSSAARRTPTPKPAPAPPPPPLAVLPPAKKKLSQLERAALDARARAQLARPLNTKAAPKTTAVARKTKSTGYAGIASFKALDDDTNNGGNIAMLDIFEPDV